jgi:hypothetical protein
MEFFVGAHEGICFIFLVENYFLVLYSETAELIQTLDGIEFCLLDETPCDTEFKVLRNVFSILYKFVFWESYSIADTRMNQFNSKDKQEVDRTLYNIRVDIFEMTINSGVARVFGAQGEIETLRSYIICVRGKIRNRRPFIRNF